MHWTVLNSVAVEYFLVKKENLHLGHITQSPLLGTQTHGLTTSRSCPPQTENLEASWLAPCADGLGAANQQFLCKRLITSFCQLEVMLSGNLSTLSNKGLCEPQKQLATISNGVIYPNNVAQTAIDLEDYCG
jgi:hypothetical protein